MSPLLIKNKVLQEIELIPEDKLAEVYEFIHDFRLGLEQPQPSKAETILSFAGCWRDMPDETFDNFAQEIEQRRRRAFTRRRSDESIAG